MTSGGRGPIVSRVAELNDVDVRETLLALEVALARRDVTALPGGLEGVLDDRFLEIGTSGRTWTREATIAALLAERLTSDVTIADFEVDEVGPGVVIARFVSVGPDDRRALRSSVWVRADAGWRLRFHQGTGAAERRPT